MKESIVYRKSAGTKKSEQMAADQANSYHDTQEDHRLLTSSLGVSQRSLKGKRNLWFIIWILPVVFVLFALPLQEELELMAKGEERAVLEDRVTIISNQVPGFVVVHVATTPQRWTTPIKSKLLSSQHCTRIWGTNETLLNNPTLRLALPRIKHIRVVGERNSGTRMLISDLSRALRNVTVESGVTRWGYWFQDARFLEDEDINPDETLVIHVALEPYEWFARMQSNPIHAPNHRKPTNKLDVTNWINSSAFFTRSWTCPRPEWDDATPTSGFCQNGFPVDEIMPCLGGKGMGVKANKQYPVYEMDPLTKNPFPSVIQLRSAKLKNFIDIGEWMPHVIHVRSRDISTIYGVNAFISALLDKFRFSVACKVTKREQTRVSQTIVTSSEDVSWLYKRPEALTKVQTRLITCNLDWNLERELGFEPREKLDTSCPDGFIGERKPTGKIKKRLFTFLESRHQQNGRRHL